MLNIVDLLIHRCIYPSRRLGNKWSSNFTIASIFYKYQLWHRHVFWYFGFDSRVGTNNFMICHYLFRNLGVFYVQYACYKKKVLDHLIWLSLCKQWTTNNRFRFVCLLNMPRWRCTRLLSVSNYYIRWLDNIPL